MRDWPVKSAAIAEFGLSHPLPHPTGLCAYLQVALCRGWRRVPRAAAEFPAVRRLTR